MVGGRWGRVIGNIEGPRGMDRGNRKETQPGA